MDEIIKAVLNKFLRDAKNGIVYVSDTPCFVKFYSKIEEIKDDKDSIPILNIRDFDDFFELIKKYIIQTLDLKDINDKNFKRFVEERLLSLFVNATYNDFENPSFYIDRLIDFHKNKLLYNEIKINDVEILDDSNIVVCMEKQNLLIEVNT